VDPEGYVEEGSGDGRLCLWELCEENLEVGAHLLWTLKDM